MQIIMKVKQQVSLQQQEKTMIDIAISGICREMHVNGQQNTLTLITLVKNDFYPCVLRGGFFITDDGKASGYTYGHSFWNDDC